MASQDKTINKVHNIHDNYIRNILNNIQNSVDTSQFVDLENTQIELKAISHSGEWNSLHETVCAFLNTDGGIIIGGIKEKDKQYIITGFCCPRPNDAT